MNVGDTVTLKRPYRDNPIYGKVVVVADIRPWPHHPDSLPHCFYIEPMEGLSNGPWNQQAFDIVEKSGPW